MRFELTIAFIIVCGVILLTAPGGCQNRILAGEPYRGYTIQNFPRANWCNCSMCQYIRARSVRTLPVATTKARAVMTPRRSKTVVKQASRRPGSILIQNGKRYRWERRQVTRLVPTIQKIRQCCGGRCSIINQEVFQNQTSWVSEWVEVNEEPVEKSEPEPEDQSTVTELHSTPLTAVHSMFELIPEGGTFFDLGSGDGRVLEVAYERGYRPIGIELDKSRAKKTRLKLRGKAFVVRADVRDVPLGNADVIYMWLFPDLIEQLELPETATIISYSHSFPGSKQVEVNGHKFFLRRKLVSR